eukprot:8688866-Pyramimonas_sp.AAC.1
MRNRFRKNNPGAESTRFCDRTVVLGPGHPGVTAKQNAIESRRPGRHHHEKTNLDKDTHGPQP